MRYKQVLVIGSSDDNRYDKEAFLIGKYIAEKGYVLITGGRGGIMEAASRGAASINNGIVIGILPGGNHENANEYCNVVIPTGIGYARNIINILSADILIAIGGKSGTLSELAYALLYKKTIISCIFAEGWSCDFPECIEDGSGSNNIYPAKTVNDVYKYLDSFFEE